MKRLIIILVAVVSIFTVASAKKKNEGGQAQIQFKETRHDFGKIPEQGGPVSCTFEFTNIGNGTLVIMDASAECGCTRPEYPENPIAPGKKGKIKVTYNPIARPGSFDKTVTVRANGKPKKVYLRISGEVVPGKK